MTTVQLVFATKTADTSVSNLSSLDGRASGPYRFFMKYFFLLSLIACATKHPITNHKDELVHVSTVMDQVQLSYMKGCMDAYREIKLPEPIETCKVKAKDHRLEIQSILDQQVR